MAIESKMNRGPIGRSMSKRDGKKKGSWTWIGFLLLVVLIVGGWYFFSGQGNNTNTPDQIVASGEYQAVFLDNGQVYFGRLTTTKDQFYILEDVFYLDSSVAVEKLSSLSLTKLGNEAHGPENEMKINVDHILFIEDMKGDSKVVQAMQAYQSN